jgi:hypothetical protein
LQGFQSARFSVITTRVEGCDPGPRWIHDLDAGVMAAGKSDTESKFRQFQGDAQGQALMQESKPNPADKVIDPDEDKHGYGEQQVQPESANCETKRHS